MTVEPVEFPSFTSGALSRTNTSGASQSGRPCKIHSATALPASGGRGSTRGPGVLAWPRRTAGCHLDHEPPDVVHGHRTGRTPAGPVEAGQEMADLASEQPHRSRSHLPASRRGELFQDFTRALAEARTRAHHPPGHPAGPLELQHHAGRLHQGVPPVPADLAVPRTLLLARSELVDHVA